MGADMAVGRRWSVSVSLALTALMLVAVVTTTGIVHLSWSYAARKNVGDLVAELNRQVAGAVDREIYTAFRSAEGASEAVRSILFQGAIRAEDEAKREFVFVSILRSQPSISWVGFGFPNGDFFGAQKTGDGAIAMVEANAQRDRIGRRLRIDRYQPESGDIMFLGRSFEETRYVGLEQPWYGAAVDQAGTAWTVTPAFPNGGRPAVSVSAPVLVGQEFRGVLVIAIELDRLSAFLASLPIGKTGAAEIVDGDGAVIAAPEARRHHLGAVTAQLGAATPFGEVSELVTGDMSVFAIRSPLAFLDWQLVTAIPRADFLADIDRNTRLLLWAVAALVVVAAVTATLIVNRLIGRPILRIAGELRHIESFALDRVRHRPSPLRELDGLSAALVRMAGGLAAFGKYIPGDVVRGLVRQGREAKVGCEIRPLSILFADLPGFTRLTERLGPGVEPYLSSFLTVASKVVHDGSGTIDKFIGDAVMAFWGAPQDDDDHALNACRGALGLRDAMRNLAPAPGADPAAQRIRIGINSGPTLVGNIGSDERLSYTAIGDAVNLASRLEALCKHYGVEVIAGEATIAAAGSRVVARELDRVAVYGRDDPVRIYELLGIDCVAPGWVTSYAQGLTAYRAGEWSDAVMLFDLTVMARGGDGPSEAMIARCRDALAGDRPAGEVLRFDQK